MKNKIENSKDEFGRIKCKSCNGLYYWIKSETGRCSACLWKESKTRVKEEYENRIKEQGYNQALHEKGLVKLEDVLKIIDFEKQFYANLERKEIFNLLEELKAKLEKLRK